MSEHTLEKTYTPEAIERRWYTTWEEAGYFSPAMKGTPFSIMIPPPNVTGSLHMGHALEATLIDTLIRFHRMAGDNTLWQVGTDHAGIATQMVVERNLSSEGESRLTLGRQAFIDRIWSWKEKSGNHITQQLRRMGASPDWSRERFTMDESLSTAVQEVFIRLYEEKLIYRGNRLVNWDPVFESAVSDLEVISEEESGHLWHICYPLSDGSGHVEVATTRPETLFGDMAVAVHPEDERYQQFIGKTLALPLTDREIPIIADDYVDPAFGSGCVKITPAHDFNDYEVGQRHQLDKLNIFTPKAALNENVPPEYQGLERYEARKAVIAALKQKQFLSKTEAHTHKVPRGDRSGAVLEPYLTKQWYVKVAPLAEPAIKAVEDGDITFYPQQWENTYFAWMRNVQDWCISRQLWWGHRIPAWYDDGGQVYVGENEEAVRTKHHLDANIQLSQDEDVLDTWFSSALWPFSTLGWPDQQNDFKTFYPSSVLVTGFDIIFFWVARMIMFGLKFTKQVPFKEVYIHGLIRDSAGKKMSKSKGNVLDPIDLIDGITADDLTAKRTTGLMQPQMRDEIARKTREEFPEGISAYGTDALRFTFASLASTGRHIQFDFNRLAGYRNFCNKLWNAARYILINTNEQDTELGDEAVKYSVADRWIHSKLQDAIAETTSHIQHYRFDLAANTLYEFIWHEFCDWYLELSKPILMDAATSPVQRRGTHQTLIDVFETLLRLLHPIAPFITEEIWQKVAPFSGRHNTKTIMHAKYPIADENYRDRRAEQDVTWLKQVIVAIRNIRGEMNISPNKTIAVLLQQGDNEDHRLLAENQDYLKTLARLASIAFLSPGEAVPPCASALVNELEIKVPLAGTVNVAEETSRLQKVLHKHQTELKRSENKLNNPGYVDKAPAHIVATERERVETAKKAIDKITQQLEDLANLQKFPV